MAGVGQKYGITGSQGEGWTFTGVGAFTSLTNTGVTTHAVGAVGTPSITFTGDTNTGLYWIGANSFGLTANGVVQATITTAGINGVLGGTTPAAVSATTVTATRTDSSTGTVTPFNFALTATGIAAAVDGGKFSTTTEVALGTYANALNAKLDFGTAGSATGLGGAMCSELDLGPGTSSGSYAVFEAELNCPSGASTGTRTSFFSLNAWGADVATIDTAAFLFDLNGLTAASGKLFNSGLSQVVTAAARLRCQVGGTTYYIPLCAAEALSS